LATDDDNAIVFDVSTQQNVWRDDSHGVSSSLSDVHFFVLFRSSMFYLSVAVSSLSLSL